MNKNKVNRNNFSWMKMSLLKTLLQISDGTDMNTHYDLSGEGWAYKGPKTWNQTTALPGRSFSVTSVPMDSENSDKGEALSLCWTVFS